jgi:hypothetical protein
MAIEGVQGAGAQPVSTKVMFHEDITNQIFKDVKPRTEAAAKTEEQAATQKTDEVTTTEPSEKAKADPKKIDDIIKSMQESVSKLGSADYDSGAIQKELDGLQEQLQKFVGGYNDALKYAQSSSNENALSYAASMVTRTAANQDPFAQLGINVNDDNTFSQIESIASMKDNNEAIAAMKDLFSGNYSYAAKTMESVQGIFAS